VATTHTAEHAHATFHRHGLYDDGVIQHLASLLARHFQRQNTIKTRCPRPKLRRHFQGPNFHPTVKTKYRNRWRRHYLERRPRWRRLPYQEERSIDGETMRTTI